MCNLPGSIAAAFSYFTLALTLSGAAPEARRPKSLAEAVKAMTVPQGFQISLFAGEPDVVQPIAMTMDERGRLWVVECLSYPDWQAGAQGRDRVVIFEDRDGDGRFDSRTLFWDRGRNLSGIALGFGGVWLCSTPELIFIPDRDRDDKPDGGPETVLDGWNLNAKHNVVNGLAWGPDGWLYGCHGILSDVKVGRPGTPPEKRISFTCGVWRFHPIHRLFEVVAHGTTNPWGIAFDENGQLFIANCVIKHLFHVIPGAHYERMYGQDINPYSFRLMESCADHIHWAGGFWKTEGAEHSQNDSAGGGHAHCGAMVYLGDNWPASYRNRFFTLNVHGHRINQDQLVPRGSGYIAQHRADFMKANDSWFRGTALLYGPDGGVYVSDWTDAGECHDYLDIHRDNGRIYKLTYGQPTMTRINLAKLSDKELLALQFHKNEWFVDQARRFLQERAASQTLEPGTLASAVALLEEPRESSRQLRALWAVHALGGLTEKVVPNLLSSPHEQVRAWTVRLTFDNTTLSTLSRSAAATPSTPGLIQEWAKGLPQNLLTRFKDLAIRDRSPVVRLSLASALQRLQAPERLTLAQALLSRAEDASDPNLPLMIWYGVEPLISTNDAAAHLLLSSAQLPLPRQLIAQRLALRLAVQPAFSAILDRNDPAVERDIIFGIFEALQGRRQIPMSPNWPQVAAKVARHRDLEVRHKGLFLSAIFGDAAAISQLIEVVRDSNKEPAFRQKSLETLIQVRAAGLLDLLQNLLADETLRAGALRGLAVFGDPGIPGRILQHYPGFTGVEKAEAINTFASRPLFGIALLQAVKRGTVPRGDISPFAARQLHALKDERIAKMTSEILGDVRSVNQDKAAQIARYKERLTESVLKTADRSQGRRIFVRTCAPCHRLFDEGGTLAPELTGSQRENLDYILENVLDPNAVVWNQYRTIYFETADEQMISGVVLRENESTVTLQTQTGIVTLPRTEITSRRESNLSMMPEGLFDSLKPEEVIDLAGYLQSPVQVPLPAAHKP